MSLLTQICSVFYALGHSPVHEEKIQIRPRQLWRVEKVVQTLQSTSVGIMWVIKNNHHRPPFLSLLFWNYILKNICVVLRVQHDPQWGFSDMPQTCPIFAILFNVIPVLQHCWLLYKCCDYFVNRSTHSYSTDHLHCKTMKPHTQSFSLANSHSSDKRETWPFLFSSHQFH